MYPTIHNTVPSLVAATPGVRCNVTCKLADAVPSLMHSGAFSVLSNSKWAVPSLADMCFASMRFFGI